MSDSKWNTVCACERARACVFLCAKGSGLVAKTIGTPTAFCSDALSPEPSSKHHGKTIKTSSKSLLLRFSFFLFVLLSPFLFISPYHPLHLTLIQPIFTQAWASPWIGNFLFLFHFPPEMPLIGGTAEEGGVLYSAVCGLWIYTCVRLHVQVWQFLLFFFTLIFTLKQSDLSYLRRLLLFCLQIKIKINTKLYLKDGYFEVGLITLWFSVLILDIPPAAGGPAED